MTDLKNPSKILGYLYLGGKQDAKAKNLLLHLKIKYILNVTPPRSLDPESGCPSFFEKEKCFVYKRIPVFDNRGEDLIQYMDQSYRFIEEGKHYGGVLVHCHKGVSRSSTFVIGYLMKKNGMTLDEALEYVKTIRPIVMPNLAFMAQLRAYEITLEKERQNAVESFDVIIPREANASSSSGPRTVSIGPCMGPSIEPSCPQQKSALTPDITAPFSLEIEQKMDDIGPCIGPMAGPMIEISGETPTILDESARQIPVEETPRFRAMGDIEIEQDKKRAKNNATA